MAAGEFLSLEHGASHEELMLRGMVIGMYDYIERCLLSDTVPCNNFLRGRLTLRIAQFSDSFMPIVDGVGRVVFAYASAIGRKGHESYVISPLRDTGFNGGYPFENINFISKTLPVISQYSVGLPNLDPQYNSRIDMLELDLIHVHSPFIAGKEGAHLAKKRSLPLVGTFHSKYYDDFLQITKSERLAGFGAKMVADFYERCDEVWAVSSSSAGTLTEYGYKGPIKVIANGTDIRTLDPDAAKEVDCVYSLGEDPILLYAGQLNWKKNILRILEAASLLFNKGLRFKLVLAGQGPHKDEISKKAEELGIGRITVFTGHIASPAMLDALYHRACLFVFPSIYDNAPMVVREAAAMSTPSVVVRGSSASEIIVHGENGLLCGDSSQELADVILSAISNHGLIEQMGKRAYETIPIAWDTIIETVLGRYKVLCDLKNSRRSSLGAIK